MWFLLMRGKDGWHVVDGFPVKSEAEARRRMAEVATADGPSFCLANASQMHRLTTKPTWVVDYPSEEK